MIQERRREMEKENDNPDCLEAVEVIWSTWYRNINSFHCSAQMKYGITVFDTVMFTGWNKEKIQDYFRKRIKDASVEPKISNVKQIK